MLRYKTPGQMGYACEFSPFAPNLLAVSTSQHFGVVGNGRQHILSVSPQGVTPVGSYDTKDGVYDCSWNESNENQLASACGDGTVKLWDIQSRANPLRDYREHTAECYSVDWNGVNKVTFVTGAWDNSCKVWDPNRQQSVRTFLGHQGCVYQASWNPRQANVFASCSGDNSMRIWDANSGECVMAINVHRHEVLCADWSKYNEHLIVSGSVDKTVRVTDLRKPHIPLTVLRGHEYAVRRIKTSPHSESTIMSCSYDMSVIIWNYQVDDAIKFRYDHHQEFVLGCAFNNFIENQVATASWDESVSVFQVGHGPHPIMA